MRHAFLPYLSNISRIPMQIAQSNSHNLSRTVITAFIDAQQAAQRAFLREMVKVPSDNPAGDCAPHGARAQALLQQLGFDVEAYPVPQALVHANGMISVTNLIVRRRFGAAGSGGPTIALNAHGDVVPPGSGWSKDPYGGEIVDDPVHGPVMYGRGVAVSKSDFATYTWALLALVEAERQGAVFNGSIELQFTYDEEAGGGGGPKRVFEEGAWAP